MSGDSIVRWMGGRLASSGSGDRRGRNRESTGAAQFVYRCMPKKAKEPWEKKAPAKSKRTMLTPKSKAKAKSAAKKAGRKYPSLVDNRNAAKKQRGGKAKSAKKS